MNEINQVNIRTWSMMGHRGCFALALLEIAEQDDSLRVLTADLGSLTGLDRLKKNHPEMLINTGIAEQNMIGVAAGLAKEGHTVYATTYSNFLAMRSYEQVRINLGYMGFPVNLVGTGSGIAMGMSGNSHYGLEDLALMRALPGMTVLSPADGVEIIKTVLAVREYNEPTYIRLSGGMNLPVVYTADYDFSIGKAVQLREGDDVAIFATGTMVYQALLASDSLKESGISASVMNMHTIKPLDCDAVRTACEKVRLIVSIEEHGIIGGLGGAISEYTATLGNVPPQLFLGLPDRFGKIGEYEYMLKKYGLTGEAIAKTIEERIKVLS